MILVVGPGGNGQTYFMDFLIENKISINDHNDKDCLKHMPSPLNIPNNVNIEKCIFLYNHPYYCLLSHYRRKWALKQCKKLGNPFKLRNEQIQDFNTFKELTLKHNKDIYGIENQFVNWLTLKPSFPILFLNFKEVLDKKDILDNFLGVKLDYTNFKEESRHTYITDELYPIYDSLFEYMKSKINMYKYIPNESNINMYKYVPTLSIDKCQRNGCKFKVHTNIQNNGGTHCCRSCKDRNSHGPACEGQLID